MNTRTGISVLAGAAVLAAALLWGIAPQDAATAPRKKVRIVAVYGARSIAQHELGNYRVRIAPGATQPVEYHWDFDDGTGAEGVMVAHRFDRPGRYRVRVTARNVYGTDTDSLFVTVRPAPAPPPAAPAGSSLADTARVAVVSPAAAPEAAPARPASQASSIHGRGGYSWVVATHLHREAAEADVLQYRKAGYRTRLMIDQSGSGSTAYRVLVGHFNTSQSALRARNQLPADRPGGVWLLKLPDTPQPP